MLIIAKNKVYKRTVDLYLDMVKKREKEITATVVQGSRFEHNVIIHIDALHKIIVDY